MFVLINDNTMIL